MAYWMAMLVVLGACAGVAPVERAHRVTAKTAHRAPAGYETKSASYVEEHIVPRFDAGRARVYFGSFAQFLQETSAERDARIDQRREQE